MKTLTYFISDTHLGARHESASEARRREQRLCRWLEEIEPTAKRLYMLGDILDFWWEYRKVVPRGHVRFFGALARLADSGTEITWLRGNHDIWLKDYLAAEIPARVVTGALQEEIDGTWFFLEHGDGVGRRSFGKRLLRGFFHNPLAQKVYSAIHPRWGVALAQGWSKSSRQRGTAAREDSPGVVALTEFAREYSSQHPEIKHFLFGHVHYPLSLTLETGADVTILGTWLDEPNCAVFDGKKIEKYVV